MGGFLGVAGRGGRSGTSERAEIMPHSHALATVEGEAGGGRQRPRPFVTFATLAIGLIATAMDNREAEGATQSTNCPGARCSPRFHRPGARTFFRDTCSARRAPPVRNYSRFLATKPRSGTRPAPSRRGKGLAFEKSPGRLIRFAPKALRNAAGRTRFVPELGLLARNCGFSRTRSSRFVGFYVEKARSAVEPGLARACARQISSSDSLWSGASEGSRPKDGAFRGAGPEPCAAIRPGLRQQRFNRDGSDFVEKGAFRRLGQRNRSPLAYGGVMVGYWRDGKYVAEGVRFAKERERLGSCVRDREGARRSADKRGPAGFGCCG